jgi:hypothetical protein
MSIKLHLDADMRCNNATSVLRIDKVNTEDKLQGAERKPTGFMDSL